MGRNTCCESCGKETNGQYEIGDHNQVECSECYGEDLFLDDKIELVYDKTIVLAKIKEYTDVLEAIEELCYESDNERYLMEGKFTNAEISLANTISNIYKLAHSSAGHCKNSHEDWKLK